DNENCIGRCTHEGAPRSSGNETQNVAPRSELLNAQRRPPWASTIERQIDNPRPSPRDFVVTNGFNKLSGFSVVSPVPRSVTEIRMAFSAGAVATSSPRSPGVFAAIASHAL